MVLEKVSVKVWSIQVMPYQQLCNTSRLRCWLRIATSWHKTTASAHMASMLLTCCLLLRLCVFTLVLLLSACTAFGPKRVPADRFNYNEAISRSEKEQMLLNLVRMRYRDIPVFLAVSSVLTQYSYSGGVGVSGFAALDASTVASSTVGGMANLGYTERPTITYTPLSGSEFSRRMLSPIAAELMFAAAQAGWPTELLFLIALQRVNDVENMSFGAVSSPHDLERLRKFKRVLYLFRELGTRGALEMYRDHEETTALRYLVFGENLNRDTQAFADELKNTLGLDPTRNQFRVTARLTKRDPDEITIQPRSLAGVMSFLARGTEAPALHLKEDRVVDMGSWGDLVPFRILSSPTPPKDAFSAVWYQGHWFYIAHSDHESKRVLGLLIYIFRLQAPATVAATPILSLPTGP